MGDVVFGVWRLAAQNNITLIAYVVAHDFENFVPRTPNAVEPRTPNPERQSLMRFSDAGNSSAPFRSLVWEG
jgi:hypothetical protein